MILEIFVQPGASKSEVVPNLGSRLRIRVTAPPEKGRATRAAIQTLAEWLGIKESEFSLRSGRSSRYKLVELPDVYEEKVKAKFESL